jgi:hypothetical protein
MRDENRHVGLDRDANQDAGDEVGGAMLFSSPSLSLMNGSNIATSMRSRRIKAMIRCAASVSTRVPSFPAVASVMPIPAKGTIWHQP